jgi:hypothetical protein
VGTTIVILPPLLICLLSVADITPNQITLQVTTWACRTLLLGAI